MRLHRFYCRALTLFLSFWGCCLPVSAQIQAITPKTDTRAVVVGISNYVNVPRLRFAHKDAEAFEQYLRSPAGGNVPESHIRLLTNEHATYAQIGKALSWLNSASQPGDQAIIFFSGHGDVETDMPNVGYLLAHDVNKSTYMAGGAMPISQLQAVIDNLAVNKQVQVLLIADACRSGNLAGSETGGGKTTALAMAAQFSNATKIMSCGPDEFSLEDERWGGGRSVFSYYLIDGLRGLADANEDRQVTLREIRGYLQDSVETATRALQLQSPTACCNDKAVVATVDPATLTTLRQKKLPPITETNKPPASNSSNAVPNSDTTALRLYQAFESAVRTGHLLFPEEGAAYTIYEQIKDEPALKTLKNPMRNDLAAALQDEAQKAINDYLSADPREMRRRWSLDDSRYRLYPKYLEKAAELLGEGHFSYQQLKAKEHYFSGLNLRLLAERPENAASKDSLIQVAKALQQKTLQLDTTAAYAYNELGLLARRLGDYPQSVADFNRALRFSPRWVLPWANLCGSYMENSQLDAAQKSGKKALSIDSTFALAHYNLGYAYWQAGEMERAGHHFQKTIEYNPDYLNAYLNLGIYHYLKEAYPEAEKAWMAYQTKAPDDPEIYQNLGEVALKLNKASLAESHFLKAIELDPAFSMPYFSLGEYHLAKSDWSRAEQWLQTYANMEPKNPEGHFQLAIAQHQHSEKALRTLEQALQTGFNDKTRLLNDNRFSSLRKTAAYKQLAKKYLSE